MFNQTTELAFRALLVLALEVEASPASPRKTSVHLKCSTTYLSKTLGLLVKAGILSSFRGAHGGVSLARKPEDISMLQVVEACEGPFRTGHCPLRMGGAITTCSFHMAVQELHKSKVQILTRYSLADLAGRSKRLLSATSGCRLAILADKHVALRSKMNVAT